MSRRWAEGSSTRILQLAILVFLFTTPRTRGQYKYWKENLQSGHALNRDRAGKRLLRLQTLLSSTEYHFTPQTPATPSFNNTTPTNEHHSTSGNEIHAAIIITFILTSIAAAIPQFMAADVK